MRTLKRHRSSVYSVAFSNDGLLATCSSDTTIKIWNPYSGNELSLMYAHSTSVRSIAFGESGLLASGSADLSVKIWNLYNKMNYLLVNGNLAQSSLHSFFRDL